MAVTIEEMHVEVQGAKPAPGVPASHADPKKKADTAADLVVLHERQLRLKAD